MNTRWWRIVRIMVTMLSLTMLIGLAGPASAQQSDAKTSCKKGGWQTLVTADGDTFKNQGACVSYVVADGGVPVPPSTGATVTLDVIGPSDGMDGYCDITVSFRGFADSAQLDVAFYQDDVPLSTFGGAVDGEGNHDFPYVFPSGHTYRFDVADPFVTTGDVEVSC